MSPDLDFRVGHDTAPAPREVDEREYHIVDGNEFDRLVASGRCLSRRGSLATGTAGEFEVAPVNAPVEDVCRQLVTLMEQ